MKFRLLDLFCGAGGCSVGYHRAGFEVIGVDIKPQPRYPYEFYQLNAMEVLVGGKLSASPIFHCDVIHASPPCQAFSALRVLSSNLHPDLLTPVRALIQDTGLPYVIENVPGAPMRGRGITLCGSMFRLVTNDGTGQLQRHRHFESNAPLVIPATCNHNLPAVPCFGGGGTQTNRRSSGPKFREHHRKEAMGIDWMSRRELAQAIPPAYTEYIGRQLMDYLKRRAA